MYDIKITPLTSTLEMSFMTVHIHGVSVLNSCCQGQTSSYCWLYLFNCHLLKASLQTKVSDTNQDSMGQYTLQMISPSH